MNARLAGVLLLALACGVSRAASPSTFADAWSYVSAPGETSRWVVVTSAVDEDSFFQCQNHDDVVLCAIPVWMKKRPHQGDYRVVGDRDTPYPELDGAKINELLSAERTAAAQKVLRAYGLAPLFIYSKMEGRDGSIFGTQCELRVVLPLQYKQFEQLAKSYLKDVFGRPESAGYRFATDS